MARDPRYSTARWRRIRELVLRRDGRICSVPGCRSDMSQRGMTHIGHVVEVKDGGAFWDPYNCRVVCRFHHYSKTVETMGERQSGRVRRSKIPSPFDPANPPPGCTCNLRGAPTPRSPNDIFCPTCEAIIKSRRNARDG